MTLDRVPPQAASCHPRELPAVLHSYPQRTVRFVGSTTIRHQMLRYVKISAPVCQVCVGGTRRIGNGSESNAVESIA